MAKTLGIDEHQFLDAIRHYQKTVLAVKRSGATIYEAAVEFKKEIEREKNVRTLYKYRSTTAPTYRACRSGNVDGRVDSRAD